MEPDATREVFRGKLIRVEVERWPSGEREVVRHPGACAVVAITLSNQFVLVKGVRESVREELLEIPAGIYDVDGEDPAGCAARELLEETGYVARALEPLGTIYTSPGFTDERIDLFIARAEPMTAGRATAEEGVDVVLMPSEEALSAVRDGRIRDAKSIVGLLLVGNGRRASEE